MPLVSAYIKNKQKSKIPTKHKRLKRTKIANKPNLTSTSRRAFKFSTCFNKLAVFNQWIKQEAHKDWIFNKRVEEKNTDSSRSTSKVMICSSAVIIVIFISCSFQVKINRDVGLYKAKKLIFFSSSQSLCLQLLTFYEYSKYMGVYIQTTGRLFFLWINFPCFIKLNFYAY